MTTTRFLMFKFPLTQFTCKFDGSSLQSPAFSPAMESTILANGATSERSSLTDFVVGMLGRTEELAASVQAERRPVIISYKRL